VLKATRGPGRHQRPVNPRGCASATKASGRVSDSARHRGCSLITIVALAALGDDDQLGPYVQRGMENGLAREQIVEAIAQLGFFGGWSRATRALTAITTSLGR
jgi:hypothetical protein